MEFNEILLKVQDVFRDVLDNDEIELSPETSSNDIDEWDSLSHIQLIVAIEDALDVEFTSQAIISWKNVGDMVTYIQTHKA